MIKSFAIVAVDKGQHVYLRNFCEHTPGNEGKAVPVFSELLEDAILYTEEEADNLVDMLAEEYENLELEVWGLNHLDFSEALEYLKEGHKIARDGWNGKDQYIQLSKQTTYQDYSGPHKLAGPSIIFHGTNGVQVGWLASQGDMLAEDWVVLG